jgi:hypothetical protein
MKTQRTWLSQPMRATGGKAMVRRGIVITVANPAIGKTIVGRKVAERRTRSRIG